MNLSLSSSVLSLLLLIALGAACETSTVDETGYLRLPDIDTTSEQAPVLEQATRIVVVGNPGAVSKSGGIIKVAVSSGDEGMTAVDDPEGSFVVAVDAMKGDAVTLFYLLDGEDSVDLNLDGTASRIEPGCSNCTGQLFSAPDADGNTSLSLTLFDNPNPPYTLYNQNQGTAVRATDIGIVKLAAETGDRLCVYESGPDATSETLCDLVP